MDNANETAEPTGASGGYGGPCLMCRERVKDWSGDDPKCFFVNTERNWNCATINALRDIVYEGQQEMPDGVDYRYCEDQKYATVCVDGIDGLDGALALWVTWYKSRGSTDGVWLLFSDQPPRAPKEDEVRRVVDFYKP